MQARCRRRRRRLCSSYSFGEESEGNKDVGGDGGKGEKEGFQDLSVPFLFLPFSFITPANQRFFFLPFPFEFSSKHANRQQEERDPEKNNTPKKPQPRRSRCFGLFLSFVIYFLPDFYTYTTLLSENQPFQLIV